MKTLNPVMARALKRLHHRLDVIHVRAPVCPMRQACGPWKRWLNDHSTVHRRALKRLPVLKNAFLRR
ncbi:hypothetical protein [Cupriavidus necator]|uniref:hypothetical protein n=1 Tax=Cupriavidus necator TaxID=106590 RepID=UPI0012D2A23C|nr:hypothetical protein [Cupriavidus necator]